MERALLLTGMALLVWSAAMIADARFAQWRAWQSLEATATVGRPAVPPAPSAKAFAPHARAAQLGAAVAALSIPRVGLSSVVLHGSDAQTLRRGPGHLENTALPGEAGNVVIAGHRDSFFRALRNIKVGDDIFLAAPDGQFHYQVTSLRVVAASDVSVLAPTDEPILTLITCYPFWLLGNAPDRFVVRAAVVGQGAAAPLALAPTSPVAPTRPVVPTIPLAPTVSDVRAPVEMPVREQPSAASHVVPPRVAAADDTTLVREAVDRFSVTYNARLASHEDARVGGPLKLEWCDVYVTYDSATAFCEGGADTGEDAQRGTFMLEREQGRWSIKSIVLN